MPDLNSAASPWPIAVSPDLGRDAFCELHWSRSLPVVYTYIATCLVLGGFACAWSLASGNSAAAGTYLLCALLGPAFAIVPLAMLFLAIESNHNIYTHDYRRVEAWIFSTERVEVVLKNEDNRSFQWYAGRTAIGRHGVIIRTSSHGLYDKFAIQPSAFPNQESWDEFQAHVEHCKDRS